MLTCQRALRAYVLTCQRAPHANVLTCLACFRAYVPTCYACLRAHLPTCLACFHANALACSHTNVPYVSRVNAPCGSICLRAITSNTKINFQWHVFLRFEKENVHEKCLASRNVSRNIYFENSVIHSCTFSYQAKAFNRYYENFVQTLICVWVELWELFLVVNKQGVVYYNGLELIDIGI